MTHIKRKAKFEGGRITIYIDRLSPWQRCLLRVRRWWERRQA